ncbi:YciI family protein [Lentzea sp. HUAS12]|uniref:YciI family protein n=1 Tax=Lentzea sp. HUAS12 TaxID=2951806 RepID=UPI00209EC540|nr:YciI family protein [Lentzea sp. HUAS12]USX50303.1 YciI family protein [Lentzea sp. HUAS12]
MARFAVELVFGPDREKRLAVRPEHREYIASLVEKGVILASGPYADDAGALIIYEAADEASLKEIIAADPYTPAGVAEWTIREWNALMGPWVTG